MSAFGNILGVRVTLLLGKEAVIAPAPLEAMESIEEIEIRQSMEGDSGFKLTLLAGREGPLGRGLKASELAAATPYNTYVIAGLPPGPIANPGREAIAAAANPPATEDFYFVADGSGGHAFAATLEQHNANVAAWRRLEAQRALEAEEAAKAEAQEEVVGQ